MKSHHNSYTLLASAPAARFIFVPAVVFIWTGEFNRQQNLSYALKLMNAFISAWNSIYRVTQKNGNIWKTQQKLKKSKKKIIERNWTIRTCILRDSNPNHHCLKITSCRWCPPPRMHSFTATKHFKSSRSFVSSCVCCMLCRMRLRRILQSSKHSYSPVMLSYKYYLNIVTRTVSKHTARVLSCYHINITLTHSHVPSVNTQLQSCHVSIQILP